MAVRSYKDLKVWQMGVKFSLEIYQATKEFPSDERFGLTSQLRRASVSIPSNIAEGHIQRSDAVLSRHLNIALGSAAEIDTQLLIAQQIGYIFSERLGDLREQVESIMKMLHGFIQTIQPSRQRPTASG